MALALVVACASSGCKFLGGGADSKDKSVLVGNATESLLLVGSTKPEGGGPQGLCAYRVKGTGATLTASRVSDRAASIGAFVQDVKAGGKDLFPWLSALDGFTRSLLEGFAKEVAEAPASGGTALQEAPSIGNSGDPSAGGAPALDPALPPAEANRITAERVLGVALENASCFDAVADDKGSRESCKKGLHEQLLSALAAFGRVAARKAISLPAKTLEAKTETLVREIERNVFSDDALTRRNASASTARRLKDLYDGALAREPVAGVSCEDASAVVTRFDLRGEAKAAAEAAAAAQATASAIPVSTATATATATAAAAAGSTDEAPASMPSNAAPGAQIR